MLAIPSLLTKKKKLSVHYSEKCFEYQLNNYKERLSQINVIAFLIYLDNYLEKPIYPDEKCFSSGCKTFCLVNKITCNLEFHFCHVYLSLMNEICAM